jgi:hypothetical protein
LSEAPTTTLGVLVATSVGVEVGTTGVSAGAVTASPCATARVDSIPAA